MPARRDPPPGRSFRLVLLTTFATFAALYAPQPLLPLFARTFGAAPATVALLMTVTFVFLAVAPLGYGALLRRVGARELLIGASALLGLLQVGFALAPDFVPLMTARTLQGALYPAIFTSAVTYCSRAGDPRAIARRVSTYVATTVLGGLSGRLIGGFVSELIGWRATFVALGALLLGCAAALSLAARQGLPPSSLSPLAASREILSGREFRAGFGLIFLVFFTFSGCLNALPFRLVELDPDISPARISLVYIGYLVGVAIALNIDRITHVGGGQVRTMGWALAVFGTGLALMAVPDARALIGAGFLISAGMFTVHTTLSGYLNGLRPSEAGLVNGLYISLYYAAGALGSVLPLALYQHAGWAAFLGAMLAACLAGTVPLRVLGRRRDGAEAG